MQRGKISSTWLGMTLRYATALLGMIAAYLAGLGAVFRWWRSDFALLQTEDPSLFWLLICLPLVFIGTFMVGPKLWTEYIKARRRREKLGPVTTDSLYFRLDPYVPTKPENFIRQDNAHILALDWIKGDRRGGTTAATDSSWAIGFLSGMSGSGKSSVLEAYVVPMLERAHWRVSTIRSFDDPLSGMNDALASRQSGDNHLLIVFDQFEEFLTLEDRAVSDRGQTFLSRLREFRARPIEGCSILFVVRTDFLRSVIDLDLAPLDSGKNWFEVQPFRRTAARVFFLQRSPGKPGAEIIEGMLNGAEALEEVPGLFRPVTLNMLGLALREYDNRLTDRPEMLVQTYLRRALMQPYIADIAPRVVEALITAKGTKWPRTVPEIASSGKLSEVDVRLCLARLSARGILRNLNGLLWEISHDFVAKQLTILLGRLRPSLLLLAARWLSPVLFVVAIGAVFVVPMAIEQHAVRELQGLNVTITGAAADRRATFCTREGCPYGDGQARFRDASKFLEAVGISDINLNDVEFTSLEPLRDVAGIRILTLVDDEIEDFSPISTLTSLRELDLTLSMAARIRT